jgi:hypothetical protein
MPAIATRLPRRRTLWSTGLKSLPSTAIATSWAFDIEALNSMLVASAMSTHFSLGSNVSAGSRSVRRSRLPRNSIGNASTS